MINKYNSQLQFWLTLCKAIQLIKTKVEEKQMEAINIVRNMIDKQKNKLEKWQKS